jgi:glycine C-acetyltransferase
MIPSAIHDVLRDAVTEQPPIIESARPGYVRVGAAELINMASCDYLGFARDSRVTDAAVAAIGEWGLGMASTRALSGGTVLHRALEKRLAQWVGCEDSALFSSCWTANSAVFGVLASLAKEAETTLAVFSDRLNHASIIDGVRAQREVISTMHLYDHDDHESLTEALRRAPSDVLKVIVTDGIFSMEGDQAPLSDLARLATEHDALLVVDDSHGIGVVGEDGRGTAQAQGVLGQVDIVIGTLGKALGGAGGGFAATSTRLAATIRGKARPFIFSNNPATSVVAAALAALEILATDSKPLADLRERSGELRAGIIALGLPTVPGSHPIVPVIVGDEAAARDASRHLRQHGVLATALCYPIVPRGEARLRLQVSADHSREDISAVLEVLGDWHAQWAKSPNLTQQPAGAGR